MHAYPASRANRSAAVNNFCAIPCPRNLPRTYILLISEHRSPSGNPSDSCSLLNPTQPANSPATRANHNPLPSPKYSFTNVSWSSRNATPIASKYSSTRANAASASAALARQISITCICDFTAPSLTRFFPQRNLHFGHFCTQPLSPPPPSSVDLPIRY